MNLKNEIRYSDEEIKTTCREVREMLDRLKKIRSKRRDDAIGKINYLINISEARAFLRQSRSIGLNVSATLDVSSRFDSKPSMVLDRELEDG